jgi:hypothetical protein
MTLRKRKKKLRSMMLKILKARMTELLEMAMGPMTMKKRKNWIHQWDLTMVLF